MNMKKCLGAAVLVMAVAALPASVGAAGLAHRAGAMGMGMGTVSVSSTTGAYKLTLMIGPLEHMYTRKQYNKTHPKHGEIMISGTMVMGGMSGMGGMGMDTPNHHLELHVLDRMSGHVVSNAMVSISYQPVVKKGQMPVKPSKLPIAVMMGIGKGMSDLHYGNNVYMSRSAYHVWVHVNKAQAEFTVKLS